MILEICFGPNQSLQVKTTKHIGPSLLLKINFQTTEQSTLKVLFFSFGVVADKRNGQS